MDWINYHHLLYFWVVAREGGLVQAGRVLKLSHPTLSAQIRALEERLGQKLFSRAGRGLVLTDAGRVAFRYAEEIFSLGREMTDELTGRGGRPLRFEVGVVDAVPKMMARRLLAPAVSLPAGVRLACREDHLDKLLGELAVHKLDLVLADAPLPAGSSLRAFSHPLGHCGVGLFGTPELARLHRHDFPRSLDGAPLLLPDESAAVGRAARQWLEQAGVAPLVRGEFADSALMKAFGADGLGLFPAPLAVAREVCRQYGVVLVGELPGVRERFFAITMERRLKHPAVIAVTQAARRRVFATGEGEGEGERGGEAAPAASPPRRRA